MDPASLQPATAAYRRRANPPRSLYRSRRLLVPALVRDVRRFVSGTAPQDLLAVGRTVADPIAVAVPRPAPQVQQGKTSVTPAHRYPPSAPVHISGSCNVLHMDSLRSQLQGAPLHPRLSGWILQLRLSLQPTQVTLAHSQRRLSYRRAG